MDLTAQIVEAITAWLGTVEAQFYAPALGSAGDLLFATPSFDLIPEVAATWELVRNVADSLLLLVVTAAGIRHGRGKRRAVLGESTHPASGHSRDRRECEPGCM